MKNTIKTNGYILIIAFVLSFASGCSDFLSKTDPSNFTQDNYYTSPEQAESAVIAIYQDLRSVLGGGFGGAPWLMLEFATGLANTDLGQAQNSIIIRNLVNTSDNGYGNTYWTSYYRGIANANVALAQIPDIKMDEARKKQLLGEARFLRAYYYYNLVRIFGEVPLIKQPVGLDSPQLYPSAASVEEIYALIVSDLKKAENAGLPFNTNSGRVSLGAVKSLLASVYLTMAGYPLQKRTEYYKLARDKAREVIDSGEYTLFDSYDALHSDATENKGGFIFQVQYQTPGQPSNGLQYLLTPYNRGISEYSAQTGGIYAMEEFVKSYSKGDKRVEEKTFYYTKFTLAANRNKTIDLGGYYIFKLFDMDAHLNTAQSGLNWTILRYAEVLLTYAEAANEVAGPTPEAYEALNKIRERAGLKALSGLNQAAFRKAVWEERWHELSYENKTWFDMVRLRKAYNIETGKFENFVGHTFSYGPTLSERELLFPIPAEEILDNKNLTQNPGY